MEEVNTEAVKYLNRLSDWFFVAGRIANDDGKDDALAGADALNPLRDVQPHQFCRFWSVPAWSKPLRGGGELVLVPWGRIEEMWAMKVLVPVKTGDRL